MAEKEFGEESVAVLIDQARGAQRDLGEAQSSAAAARDKLAEMVAAQSSDQAERDRLRREKEQDDALRMIDGEDAVPKKARRDNRLAKLDEDAAAKTAAIRLQQLRVTNAEAAAILPHPHFVGTILAVAAAVQGDAIDESRRALATLAPAFARLIAADQIRSATLGQRYPVPNDAAPPFSGLTVIRNCIKAIPGRLLPPELVEQHLLTIAHEISSDTIRRIKGA